eukprot:1161898-Pelagomonas_calceolata.AAC.5
MPAWALARCFATGAPWTLLQPFSPPGALSDPLAAAAAPGPNRHHRTAATLSAHQPGICRFPPAALAAPCCGSTPADLEPQGLSAWAFPASLAPPVLQGPQPFLPGLWNS